MTHTIGVRREPVNPIYKEKKVYVPYRGKHDEFKHRYYTPTKSSRSRLARLIMSRKYEVSIFKGYFVIQRFEDENTEDRSWKYFTKHPSTVKFQAWCMKHDSSLPCDQCKNDTPIIDPFLLVGT